jgi:CRISPR-associated endonuclease/helicase Cas3
MHFGDAASPPVSRDELLVTAHRILFAKSARNGNPSVSLRAHTEAVIQAAEVLVDVTGEAQLSAVGLDPANWLERFRRDVRLGALLHDLGKANNHFQDMIALWTLRSQRTLFPQALRREAVSYWIARLPEIRDWVRPVHDHPPAVEMVLWAVAGHHRKFPPARPPASSRPELTVYLGHPDFHAALELGTSRLGLGPAPQFSDNRTLRLICPQSVLREFEDAHEDAGDVMASLPEDERRYIAVLKVCLICADVAGSIERRGARPITDWIPEAFGRVPTVPELRSIVRRRLDGRRPYPFQRDVAKRGERVVFVQAGCGSGKTSAAYLWAARQAAGRRLFFCYPTTGTATEGFRDYLVDPDLDAALVHGRADVDLEILRLGDEEEEVDTGDQNVRESPDRAASDSAGALEQWSTPLVSCTVDTVLGLMQNSRRGVYAWPSLARSAFVFDEIHAYDDKLFAALLRFLTDVRGVRCLLMTASLPQSRLGKIRDALASIGERLGGPVDGPEALQTLKRYRRVRPDSPWDLVEETVARGGKVLWVTNTVADAMEVADHPRALALDPVLYHSRFRYVDRVRCHKRVIEAFARAGTAAFAVTTQVAEMSLDLSADLLVTHLAPIPSLIQRLGRLNRRARPGANDGVRPFVVLRPRDHLPYTQDALDEAGRWLEQLGDGELSQADLVGLWVAPDDSPSDRQDTFVWVDGGFTTQSRPLRTGSPGIEVILPSDRDKVLAKRCRPEEVRIPMPPPPSGWDWRKWGEVAFCKVPPDGFITYDERRGAAWNH